MKTRYTRCDLAALAADQWLPWDDSQWLALPG